MERELAALVALAAGRPDEAVAMLHGAAAAEAQLPPPLGLPAPIKPAPELLGEVLVEIGRPAEAIAASKRRSSAMRIDRLSVLGLARAAAASGRPDVSRRRYTELLANYDGADADLPALREARAALAPAPAGAAPRPAAASWIAVLALTAGVVAVVAFAVHGRSKKRGARLPGPLDGGNRRKNAEGRLSPDPQGPPQGGTTGMLRSVYRPAAGWLVGRTSDCGRRRQCTRPSNCRR